jgi:hypothetical protein
MRAVRHKRSKLQYNNLFFIRFGWIFYVKNITSILWFFIYDVITLKSRIILVYMHSYMDGIMIIKWYICKIPWNNFFIVFLICLVGSWMHFNVSYFPYFYVVYLVIFYINSLYEIWAFIQHFIVLLSFFIVLANKYIFLFYKPSPNCIVFRRLSLARVT